METDALRNSVMSGLRWSTLSRLAIQGLTWAITLIVVRLLTPHDYGLATQAGIFTGYIALLSELGLGIGLIQKKITDEATLRKVFGVLLVTGTLAFIVLFLMAPLIAAFFREPPLTTLVRVAGLQFILMSFAVIPQATLAIGLKFKEQSILGIVANVCGSATTLCLAYLGFGAASLVFGVVVISLSRSVALNLVAGFVRRPSFRWHGLGVLFRFSATTVLDRTLWYGYTQADSILVGRLLGARNLGVYSVAMQLASIPMERAAEILSMVALPAFASINDSLERVAAGYMKGLRVGSTLTFPIFWGLALVAPDLVAAAFGSKWAGVTPVIQAVCVAMPVRALGPLAPPALIAVGRPGVSVRILLWGLLILPAAIAFGSLWGILGVAIAWACAIPVVFVIALLQISSVLQLPMRRMLGELRAPIACGAFMAASVVVIERLLPGLMPVVRLPLCIGVGMLAYWVALRTVAPRRLRELTDLASDFLPRAKPTRGYA